MNVDRPSSDSSEPHRSEEQLMSTEADRLRQALSIALQQHDDEIGMRRGDIVALKREQSAVRQALVEEHASERLRVEGEKEQLRMQLDEM